MLRLISSPVHFYWYPVNRFACPLLIGAKKFIEGWSSWRVSAMALLNIGSGEGSKLFSFSVAVSDCAGKNRSLNAAPVFLMTHRTLRRSRRSNPLYLRWNAQYVERFERCWNASGASVS